jgi:ATP-dependent DNA helicase RecG
MGEPATEEAANRLEVLCSSQDGFRIAEEDFAMRGPGELRGERQSGLSDLKAAQLPRDMQLLLAARRAAEASIARDPDLRDPAHAALCRAVRSAGRIAI